MKEAIYKLVDVLTFRRGLSRNINGFHVKLPARYVNYFPDNYEAANFRFLKDNVKAGDTIFDIGAHIGLFSTIAARLAGNAGRVISFEPSSETFKLLNETIRINGLSKNIFPRHAAVGDRSGKVTFFVSPIRGDNSNSIVSYKNDRELIPVEVDLVSVDDLVKADPGIRPSFMKIDVEGAELDALRGASFTMLNIKPLIILAIHPEPIKEKGDSIETIYHFIKTHGYRATLNGKAVGVEDLVNRNGLFDLHLLPG